MTRASVLGLLILLTTAALVPPQGGATGVPGLRQAISIWGPHAIRVGFSYSYGGTATFTTARGSTIPGAEQQVDIMDENASIVGSGSTDPFGVYAIGVSFAARAGHALHARLQNPLGGAQSEALQVSVGDLPGPLSSIQAVSNSATQTGLSWTPPADDGGWPVRNYQIYRSLNTSALNLYRTIPATSLSYNDIIPIYSDIEYVVKATTIIGTGPGTSVTLSLRQFPVVNASVPGFWVCHASACSLVAPGGTVMVQDSNPYTYSLNATMTAIINGSAFVGQSVSYTATDTFSDGSTGTAYAWGTTDDAGSSSASIGSYSASFRCGTNMGGSFRDSFHVKADTGGATGTRDAFLDFYVPPC